MKKKILSKRVHPKGELIIKKNRIIDTYGGVTQVSWDPDAEVTPYGQLVYFVEFLKVAELFENWVKSCPLKYSSNNASEPRDILGTIMLSLLAGHKRYAHMMSMRSDQVTPGLLGMKKVVSDDTVRRALKVLDVEESSKWLKSSLKNCVNGLLVEPWVLDIDTTIKPLYGKQEGAVVGYNPQKPGRPSHVYHVYFAGNLRLILDAEVQAGNRTASMYTQPGLWSYLDDLPKTNRPAFIRGDCAFGNENMMREAESRGINYLFKLKQTNNVKKLVYKAFERDEWEDAGKGWEGVKDSIMLTGWSKSRQAVVLRRKIKSDLVLSDKEKEQQIQLAFLDTKPTTNKYEYAVLITSLDEEVLTIAQHYRDRADIENVFDEMKNQWSWGGFTTQDLARCQQMVRIAAIVFNWWSLFAGLAFPNKHAEAITSRPLLLNSVAKQTRHAGQKKLTITSMHAEHSKVQCALERGHQFITTLKAYAEQLTKLQQWQILLSRIFVRFLKGKIIGGSPPRLKKIFAALN
jgi:Transposase DDE domain group 1